MLATCEMKNLCNTPPSMMSVCVIEQGGWSLWEAGGAGLRHVPSAEQSFLAACRTSFCRFEIDRCVCGVRVCAFCRQHIFQRAFCSTVAPLHQRSKRRTGQKRSSSGHFFGRCIHHTTLSATLMEIRREMSTTGVYVLQ